MPTEVDAHQFKVLSKDVQTCTDKVKKLALLKKICLMYRGEFLPELSGDEWVLVESVQYKNIYSESLQELCKLLIERGIMKRHFVSVSRHASYIRSMNGNPFASTAIWH